MSPKFGRSDFQSGGGGRGEESGFVDESFGALGDELEGGGWGGVEGWWEGAGWRSRRGLGFGGHGRSVIGLWSQGVRVRR